MIWGSFDHFTELFLCYFVWCSKLWSLAFSDSWFSSLPPLSVQPLLSAHSFLLSLCLLTFFLLSLLLYFDFTQPVSFQFRSLLCTRALAGQVQPVIGSRLLTLFKGVGPLYSLDGGLDKTSPMFNCCFHVGPVQFPGTACSWLRALLLSGASLTLLLLPALSLTDTSAMWVLWL